MDRGQKWKSMWQHSALDGTLPSLHSEASFESNHKHAEFVKHCKQHRRARRLAAEASSWDVLCFRFGLPEHMLKLCAWISVFDFFSTGGSLTKLAYYSTVQHKVAKVRSFDHSAKAITVLFFLLSPPPLPVKLFWRWPRFCLQSWLCCCCEFHKVLVMYLIVSRMYSLWCMYGRSVFYTFNQVMYVKMLLKDLSEQ